MGVQDKCKRTKNMGIWGKNNEAMCVNCHKETKKKGTTKGISSPLLKVVPVPWAQNDAIT